MEYIVKAKDSNIEINSPKNHKKDIISFIILFTFAIIGLIYNATIDHSFIFLIPLMILAGIVIWIDSKWSLKVNNRKIYIKKGFSNTIIDYSNLINTRLKKHGMIGEGSTGISWYLEIEHIKNNKFVMTTIPISYLEEVLPSISEFRNNFITNLELKTRTSISEEYFDIRENEITEIISKKEKEHKWKKVIIIIGIILFIIMSMIPVFSK